MVALLHKVLECSVDVGRQVNIRNGSAEIVARSGRQINAFGDIL
jgi:hypothetical protein